jgi:hypothetical protein
MVNGPTEANSQCVVVGLENRALEVLNANPHQDSVGRLWVGSFVVLANCRVIAYVVNALDLNGIRIIFLEVNGLIMVARFRCFLVKVGMFPHGVRVGNHAPAGRRMAVGVDDSPWILIVGKRFALVPFRAVGLPSIFRTIHAVVSSNDGPPESWARAAALNSRVAINITSLVLILPLRRAPHQGAFELHVFGFDVFRLSRRFVHKR